jgi:hypothetical protein
MSMQATYDDANLILRLYELRREEKLREGRAWFVRAFSASTATELNEQCVPGSEEHAFYRMVTTYWDMAASMITAGVLNEDLFFQSNGELLLVYLRMKPLLPQLRTGMQNPELYKNLEIVGELYANAFRKKGPGAFEAFEARVMGMVAKK